MSGRDTEGATFAETALAVARECVSFAAIVVFVGAWIAVAGGLA